MESIPNILELYSKVSKDDLFKRINDINGFSDKTTNNIINNLQWAIKFVEKMKPFISFKITKKTLQDLKELKVVFSGFRDKKLEEEITKRGGKVLTSVSKNITCVVTVDLNKISSKIQKAIDLNINIYQKENFLKMFNL